MPGRLGGTFRPADKADHGGARCVKSSCSLSVRTS
jgi:hypothetical protein